MSVEREKTTKQQNIDGGEDFVDRLTMEDPIDDSFEFEPVVIGLKPAEFEKGIVQKLRMAEPTDAEFEPVHFELKVPEF